MNPSIIVLILFVSIPIIFIILAVLQNRLGKIKAKVTNGHIFTPGDVVEGVVTISSDQRRQVKKARIILACAITGRKGRPLTFFAERIDIDAEFQLFPGQTWEKPFAIRIPNSIPDLPQILLFQGGISAGELPGVEKRSEIETEGNGKNSSSMLRLSKPTWQIYSEADISFGTITSERELIRVAKD